MGMRHQHLTATLAVSWCPQNGTKRRRARLLQLDTGPANMSLFALQHIEVCGGPHKGAWGCDLDIGVDS